MWTGPTHRIKHFEVVHPTGDTSNYQTGQKNISKAKHSSLFCAAVNDEAENENLDIYKIIYEILMVGISHSGK
jgi:hypothetical protein